MMLRKFLTSPETYKFSPKWKIPPNPPLKGGRLMLFWFSLSMAFSASFALRVIQTAFSAEYVIMDDGRQHIFWMQRFIDSGLFPNDLIADFYQSVSPRGFQSFYHLMAILGVDPLTLNKILPIFLGLITTGYCFAACVQILPVPTAGFVASLLLNQSLWLGSDLTTAAPTGFCYPTFMAFIYYLLRGSWLGVGISIALIGTFYAPLILVASGILILRFLDWDSLLGVKNIPPLTKGGIGGVKQPQNKNKLLSRFPYFPSSSGLGVGFLKIGGVKKPLRLRFSRDKQNYLVNLVGLVVATLVILPYLLDTSEYGPAITLKEAKTLPEFWDGGRVKFFTNDWWYFWFEASRSGIRLSLNPPLVALGLLLPFLLRFPLSDLVEKVSNKVILLLQMLVASFTLFFLAHALLFRLFLPSRYTMHSLRMMLAIAAGIALILILDAIFQASSNASSNGLSNFPKKHLKWLKPRKTLPILATLIIGAVLILYPPLVWKNAFPRAKFIIGTNAELYQYFQQQPKDIVIASLSGEADNIPTFAQRSVLVSWENALPYQTGYYGQIRQRATDLILAQYSPDLQLVQDFINTYKVDYFLLDKGAFTPEYFNDNQWFKQWQDLAFVTKANLEENLEENTSPPVMLTKSETCSVFESDGFIVLNAKCVTKEQL